MNFKIVFSDFDGTLTLNNELSPVLFDILNYLNSFRIPLVIVSGRSISWGHFFLTHFPIKYCIMEGGGVILRKSKDGIISDELLVTNHCLDQLGAFTKEVEKKFPGKLSSDSFGRKTDRAVELKMMRQDEIDSLVEFLESRGLKYSFSNVHLNFYCGDLSKANAVMTFLKSDFPDLSYDDCLFFGDAPNDESLFKAFKHSVGVSNISKYIDQMKHLPEIVLTGPENISVRGVFNYLKSLK